MGFLNKIIKKSDKSINKVPKDQANKEAKPKDEKELTIAEINEKGTVKTVKSNTSIKDGSKKKPVKSTIKSIKKDDTKEAYRVFVKPMITEKGTYLASQNKYLFEVSINTNKVEIKKAIEALYGVKPIRVNIVSMPGKKVRYGKVRGKTKNRKKAIVSLAEGQSIEVYEGV